MTLSAANDKERQRSRAAACCLRDLRGLLRFHQAMGIGAYPLNEEVRRFLQHGEAPVSQGLRAKSNISPNITPVNRGEGLDGPQLLAALRQEILTCTRCPLAGCSPGRIQGRGETGCRLMVVGDWSLQEQGFSPTTLMGPEEDAMLTKMMAAITLRPEEVYVTNILKCCPPGGQEAVPAWWQSCFSFLQREIAVVRPTLICAMGELAARLLLGSAEPLSRLRGRFSPYRYQEGDPIPVMPTFHPGYLLRNQEMKMAAWKDLQALRRRLDQLGKTR